MSQSISDLWELALDRPMIDAGELERAIEKEVSRPELDFRTRLLIRDGVAALRASMGASGVDELLDNLAKRYGLHLTHFQSHYLLSGWEGRQQSLGTFGRLDVYLIGSCDIFLGKLFSSREKDRDDLRAMQRLFDRTELIERLHKTTVSLRQEPALREAAEKNGYIVFGDALPA